jgi:hypothetical protein
MASEVNDHGIRQFRGGKLRDVSKDKPVRFITPEFYRRHASAIAATLRPKLAGWGAHGFRIVGVSPRLELEVLVPQTTQVPTRPVEPIRVGKTWIKPRVRSSHVSLRRERRADGSGPTAIGLARAVAPGARIRVGRGEIQEFVGIAAVVVCGKRPALLTCGHAAAFSFSEELLPGDEPDGDAIATLDVNLLAGGSPLDAALCTLTDAGVDILRSSSQASTWRFQKVRPPSAVDNRERTVFWQTHDGTDSAPTADVESFDGTTAALFGPTGPSSGFVETSHNVVPGDSGSLLSLGDSLYGLCSGFVGFTAFFTPIAAALAALSSKGKKCSIYHP